MAARRRATPGTPRLSPAHRAGASPGAHPSASRPTPFSAPCERLSACESESLADSGAARRVRGEGAAAVSTHQPAGGGTMQTASTVDRSARTFLTHFFGRGLEDRRYVVERFLSKADGEIKPYARTGGRPQGGA